MKLKKSWLVVSALLLSASAQAQDWTRDSGPYVGVGLGSLKFKLSDEFDSLSDRTTAYRLFGGYQFNQNFAIEGSWGASGDLKESYSETIPDMGTWTADLKADIKVMTVRALGQLPLDRVSLFGGLGYYDADLKLRYTESFLGEVETGSLKVSDDGLTMIAGVRVPLGSVDLRAEYEWFDTQSGVDTSVFGLGVSFSF